MRRIRNSVLMCTLAALLVAPVLAAEGEEAQNPSAGADELLLEIMDVHAQLAANEVFLAQAKVIATYLEAALQLEAARKVKAYEKVLNILSRIEAAPRDFLQEAVPSKNDNTDSSPQEGAPTQVAESTYEPGAALLEVFKTDRVDHLPPVPVTRTYWKRDLAYSGNYVLPDRIADIGEQSLYVAKFSFYYQATERGAYGFVVNHARRNQCKLTVGGVGVVTTKDRETVAQGVCNLEKGLYRLEFFLAATAGSSYDRDAAAFQVKVLAPEAFDARPLTKDMMLLKVDQREASRTEDVEKKPKPIPYVDY